MKRFANISVIVLLAMILAACGAPAPEEMPAESPAQVSDAAPAGNAVFDLEPTFPGRLTSGPTAILCVQGGQTIKSTQSDSSGLMFNRYHVAGTYFSAYVWNDVNGKNVFPVGEFAPGASCSFTLLPR